MYIYWIELHIFSVFCHFYQFNKADMSLHMFYTASMMSKYLFDCYFIAHLFVSAIFRFYESKLAVVLAELVI